MTRSCPLIALLLTAGPAAAADPAVLAARVDRHLAARWDKENVRPAAPADDATFLRRIHLDLTGRIPTPAEVRAFLADGSSDKRARLIDRIVAQPAAAGHFARVWCRHWLPQTAAQFEELRPEFEDWLRGQFRENAPYDRMVRTLLAPPPGPARPAQVFLQANEYKPANLAGGTARTFLGLNLDCAQCHDHPFARWTKGQFWEFAAFFADPTAEKKAVAPQFLDGRAPGSPGRAALADWVTSAANPYFARNAVNRVWADLFGTGLVEPLDDLSGAVPPSHPELLAELADAFAKSGFDLRYLTRALTRTRAYQLASAGPDSPPQLFARFAPRAMSGDQLYDSLVLAAGSEAKDADRSAFLARFGRPDRPTHAGRTILQSLTLMNGPATAAATAPTDRGTLAAVADAPFLDAAGRVEALYLAALSRPPRPAERARLVPLVESGGAAREPRRALASVFWAVLNSHEFAVIH